jgi:hypothetical protein
VGNGTVEGADSGLLHRLQSVSSGANSATVVIPIASSSATRFYPNVNT